MDYTKTKRSVRITSISVGRNLLHADEMYARLEEEAAKSPDIIILPESWTGGAPEPSLDGGTTPVMRAFAKKYGVYIINAVFRLDEHGRRRNSAVLIGRDGGIVGVYDKNYPYWSEFDMQPPCMPGNTAPVFETDFGRVGMAICFDANFPRVWQQLSDGGADIVFWPSAYSAGTSLMAHALNHNYYIVTCTQMNDCIVYDITGREIFYNRTDEPVTVSHVTLNLNRDVFHENFNTDRRAELLRGEKNICVELELKREQWFVLAGGDESVCLKQLAASYGLETLRDYKQRSRICIDDARV